MAGLPLEGVRVLDITVVWAGPFSTMLLADMGAEVIRVESIQYLPTATRFTTSLRPSPEIVRTTTAGNNYPDRDPGARPWNRFSTFNTSARNKLSVSTDLRSPWGVEVFKKLAAISDIVIENNSARVMQGLGLGYEELKKVNPGIIMISMPGLGMTGPYRDFQGFGVTLEAMAGHSSLWGYADSDPTTNSSTYAADASAGATSAFVVLAALHHRRTTGEGQFIEMSQAETFIPFLGQAMMDYTMNGRLQTSMGNRHPYMAPHGCYRCQGDDRWAVISVGSDKEWDGLCLALGNPEWSKDSRFATALGRYNNQDDLDRLIEEWTIEKSPYEVMHALQEKGVAAGPVMHPSDVFKDPHVAERGFIVEVDHPEIGVRKIPGPLWKNLKHPGSVRKAAPCLGEDNEYVYKTLLGYSDAEYQKLVDDNLIGMDPIGS